MSRELDWRIHKYMGNDMTGWEWDDTQSNALIVAYGEHEAIVQEQLIPHYSTTWEGAGLVMEWLKNNKPNWYRQISWDWFVNKHSGAVYDKREFDDSAPMAIAKAFISAMEERDNGNS